MLHSRIHSCDKSDGLGKFYGGFVESLVKRPTLKTTRDDLAPALHVLACAQTDDLQSRLPQKMKSHFVDLKPFKRARISLTLTWSLLVLLLPDFLSVSLCLVDPTCRRLPGLTLARVSRLSSLVLNISDLRAFVALGPRFVMVFRFPCSIGGNNVLTTYL
jgi:hypothetical protein